MKTPLPQYTTPPASATDLLIRARNLVALGWTQGAYARDFAGLDTGELNPNACEVCLSGALHRAAAVHGLSLTWFTARSRVLDVINDFIPRFNDAPGRTQQEVLDVLDRAILAG